MRDPLHHRSGGRGGRSALRGLCGRAGGGSPRNQPHRLHPQRLPLRRQLLRGALGHPRAVARHQPGGCAHRRGAAGGGRPGHHVRLRLQRNPRIHARDAHPLARHPQRAGRHSARGAGDDLPASRRQEPGHGRIRRRPPAPPHPHHRGFDPARRIRAPRRRGERAGCRAADAGTHPP